MSLKDLDIYGVGFGLRYQNKQLYKTKYGAIISILIISLVLIQTVIVSQELIVKQKPEVIFAERFVSSPERFDLKPNTFNFAIGVQYPQNFTHFIDESIYTVRGELITMKKKLNDKNEYFQDWKRYHIGLHPCQSNDFNVQGTQDYFKNLVDQKSQDIYIQGNFDSNEYSVLQIFFEICQDKPYCKNKEDIIKILTNSFVAYYSNDQIVNPKEYEPFSTIGRDFYWNISPIYPKDVYVFLRNVYVQSDDGVFFEQNHEQRTTVFSNSYEQIIFGEEQYFFSFVLRFEKSKEAIYHRKYKKLDNVLAEIGGMAKALLIIGFLLTMPINSLRIHLQLSNALFSFAQNNDLKNQNYNKYTSQNDKLTKILEVSNRFSSVQQPQSTLNSPLPESIFQNKDSNLIKSKLGLENQPLSPSHFEVYNKNTSNNNNDKSPFILSQIKNNKQLKKVVKKQTSSIQINQNNHKNNIQKKNIIQIEETTKISDNIIKENSKQQLILDKKNNNNNSQIESLNKNIENNDIKNIFEDKSAVDVQLEKKNINNDCQENKFQLDDANNKNKQYLNKSCGDRETIKLSWFDYIKYYLCPWGKFTIKKQLINYSIKKIYDHLDILYLVQKLIEFEKLKSLLLDEDQIKLLQFLPKPEIDLKQLKLSQETNMDNKNIQQQKILSNKFKQKKNKQISLLNTAINNDNNEEYKTKQAILAIQNILKKDKLSSIDKKIMYMLDDQIINNIQTNIYQSKQDDSIRNQKDIIYENLNPLENINQLKINFSCINTTNQNISNLNHNNYSYNNQNPQSIQKLDEEEQERNDHSLNDNNQQRILHAINSNESSYFQDIQNDLNEDIKNHPSIYSIQQQNYNHMIQHKNNQSPFKSIDYNNNSK